LLLESLSFASSTVVSTMTKLQGSSYVLMGVISGLRN
jgi:hypothetical protein